MKVFQNFQEQQKVWDTRKLKYIFCLVNNIQFKEYTMFRSKYKHINRNTKMSLLNSSAYCKPISVKNQFCENHLKTLFSIIINRFTIIIFFLIKCQGKFFSFCNLNPLKLLTNKEFRLVENV